MAIQSLALESLLAVRNLRCCMVLPPMIDNISFVQHLLKLHPEWVMYTRGQPQIEAVYAVYALSLSLSLSLSHTHLPSFLPSSLLNYELASSVIVLLCICLLCTHTQHMYTHTHTHTHTPRALYYIDMSIFYCCAALQNLLLLKAEQRSECHV